VRGATLAHPVPMTPTTILLAYDGSAASESALRAAAALFPGARAVVVTARRDPLAFEQAAEATLAAVPPDVVASGVESLNRAAEQEAAETADGGAKAAEAAGLAAEPRVADAGGSPWHGLRRVAEEIGADVIVCGSRGLGALSRAALGSTSTGLLHHARRPVLVVPEEAGDLAGPLLIGYDGSASARAAVADAGRLFGGRDAIVVTVWESAIRRSLSGRAIAAVPNEEIQAIARDVDEHFRDRAVAVAAPGAELAQEHGLQARPEAVEAAGAAWHGLLGTARTASAAAVIAGSRGRGAVASTVLGSVSSGLVHNTDVPVLVVHD
jgi:nucleotide-binding universal stress UspA family protein